MCGSFLHFLISYSIPYTLIGPASVCFSILPASHGADSTATATTARTSHGPGRTYEPGWSVPAIATCLASRCSAYMAACYSPGVASRLTSTMAGTSCGPGRASTVTCELDRSFPAINSCMAGAACYSPGLASRHTSLYRSRSLSSPPLSRADSCMAAASMFGPGATSVLALYAAEVAGAGAELGTAELTLGPGCSSVQQSVQDTCADHPALQTYPAIYWPGFGRAIHYRVGEQFLSPPGLQLSATPFSYVRGGGLQQYGTKEDETHGKAASYAHCQTAVQCTVYSVTVHFLLDVMYKLYISPASRIRPTGLSS